MIRPLVRSVVAMLLVVATVTALDGPPGAWASAAAGRNARPIVSQPTNRGSDLRQGWYPDQPLLNPTTAASSSFGQIFSSAVQGQVYGQPIVASGTLIITTEQDYVYGLDPMTGTIRWTDKVGQYFPMAGWDCSDVWPDLGITSTPTVDPTTGTVYFVAMEQQPDGSLGYWIHAIDPTTGAEQPNFPVQIQGTATNDPSYSFDASEEFQRPGLLYLDGHVYVAFSSHCDQIPYSGWLVGVSTSGAISELWTDNVQSGHSGGGIWQSGGGLTSDGPDQILLAIGNGDPPPTLKAPSPGRIRRRP